MCESWWKIQTSSKCVKYKTKNESLLPCPTKNKTDLLAEMLCVCQYTHVNRSTDTSALLCFSYLGTDLM